MDESIRDLQRLAEQGDLEAQQRLRAHEVRLRGFPIGPWDDPEWFKQFVAAVESLRTPLPEGYCVYASSAYGYVEAGRRLTLGGGPVGTNITRSSIEYLKPEMLRRDAKGCIWLDYQTATYSPRGGMDRFHVDGFWVIFEGTAGFLWRTILFPCGYAHEAKQEIVRYTGKTLKALPLAQAALEENNIVLSRFEA